MRKNKGITIMELMISMLVIGILLSIATYIFVNFISSSLSTERAASAQADVQSVLQQIKWDILMTGYSVSNDQIAMEAENAGGDENSDVMTLKSLWFGIEAGGHWSYVMDPVINSTVVPIRNWDDPNLDIEIGDQIVFLTSTKKKLNNKLFEVTDRDTFTHLSGAPGYNITLDNSISTSMNFLFNTNGVTELQEVSYYLQDNVLMRDSIPLLDDVSDFQVAYWIDANSNQLQDNNEWQDDLASVEADPSLKDNIRLIRISILVSTRGESNYNKTETFTLEDNTITPNPTMRHTPWTHFSTPRNIR